MSRGSDGPRLGFPRAARLRVRKDFLGVQRAGQRFFTRHFIVYIRRGETEQPRVGITASKRVGNAVVRNRWKRIVREAFRTLRSELGDAIDVVVIARRGAEPPGLGDSLRELRGVFRRWRKQARG